MALIPEQDRLAFIQHAIQKYPNEEELLARLSKLFDGKTLQRSVDTLIGTQRVRRIGADTLQNNESHTEIPELPDELASALTDL